MNTFKPNDKVVCINARPQSFGVRSEDVPHVKLPNGFIEKDAVYCVREVVDLRTGDGLFIVGPQVFLYGKPIPWNGLRFRKVERKKQRKNKAASQILKTPHQQPTTQVLAVSAAEPRTRNQEQGTKNAAQRSFTIHGLPAFRLPQYTRLNPRNLIT